MRSYLLPILVTLLAFAPGRAFGCSVPPPTNQEVERLAKDVAANGVLIKGTLIQEFDAAKGQPEIIRADEVFVGDKDAKTFVIYRSKSEFDAALRPRRGIETTCDWLSRPPPYKKGEAFDRLVLKPPRTSDGAANGRWSFTDDGVTVAHGRGLDVLIENAKFFGRFQSRPASSANWGD